MKKLIKLLTIICVVTILSTGLFACSSGAPSGGGGGILMDVPTGEVGVEGGGVSGSEGTEGNYGAGQMTAGAHNDNLYYDMYLELFLKGQTDDDSGKFSTFDESDWLLNSKDRVTVTLKSGENKVANANLTATDLEGKIVFSGQTDSSGQCYMFGLDSQKEYTLTATSGESQATYNLKGESQVELNLDDYAQKGELIEIMFVIDATGSMGDEINYLKKELKDVVSRVKNQYPNVPIHMAILFYRDHTDSVTFKYTDFVDVTNKNNFDKIQKAINDEYASGGGDYEEALEDALKLATEKQWSANSTKIIFNILDAPYHVSKKASRQTYSDAVYMAAQKGIRICPILASGANNDLEYITRQAAVLTGGTFCFITDHSGIGNPHLDPEIPNVVIEKLNDLIVRLVNGYYSGTFDKPVSYDNQDYYKIIYDSADKDFIISGAKRMYRSGQAVTILTKPTDKKIALYVNDELACYGQLITQETIEDYVSGGRDIYNIFKEESYLLFEFIMPNCDAQIRFEVTENFEVIE